jgi:hypothetical protein
VQEKGGLQLELAFFLSDPNLSRHIFQPALLLVAGSSFFVDG